MLKVSFLGDISFNNSYNGFYNQNINPFQGIEDLLKQSHFNIGNLECLAKGDKGVNELKYPRLSTEAKTLSLLKYLNLKAVTLAHNHVYDNLLDGYVKTIEQLKNQEIKFLGAGLNLKEAKTELIIEENGIRLGLLNFVNHNTNPKMPMNAEVFLNYFDLSEIEKQIKCLKPRVDQLIVLLHWGGRVEEGFYPDFKQPIFARKMIDAGADLIIGGHSHTVQPFEVYKEKHIFYSLGNFCFDDIVQDDEIFQIGRYRKRKTIIPTITFSKEGYAVEVAHAKNKEGFINANNSFFVKLNMLKRNVVFKIIKNNKFLWKLYYWHLKKIVPIKMYFIEANEGAFKKIITLDLKRVIRYISK
jgi:hypothetical protein